MCITIMALKVIQILVAMLEKRPAKRMVETINTGHERKGKIRLVSLVHFVDAVPFLLASLQPAVLSTLSIQSIVSNVAHSAICPATITLSPHFRRLRCDHHSFSALACSAFIAERALRRSPCPAVVYHLQSMRRRGRAVVSVLSRAKALTNVRFSNRKDSIVRWKRRTVAVWE